MRETKAPVVDRKKMAGGKARTVLIYVNPKMAGPMIWELKCMVRR
jgi:hypothetical protein